MTLNWTSRWTLSVFLVVAAGVAWAGPEPKVEICHIPPGNPSNFHTIMVNANALAAHLAHGDFAGPCENNCALFSTLCDDGNACTADACNPVTGNCQTPILKDCSDGDPCTLDDACDPASGDCINTHSAGAACDDGDACTANDACLAGGGCAGSPIPGCCDSDADCDDSNPCTMDDCSPGTQSCAHTDVVCDDGDICTVDACNLSDGSCVSAPISCDDGTVCTTDFCLPDSGCQNTAVCFPDHDPLYSECLGTPCDDGNLCTVNDSCSSGTCAGEAVTCADDGDACTEEFCDLENGCTERPLDCDDGDDCTTDSCDPDDGCAHSLNPGCCESDADCPGQCWSCNTQGFCEVQALTGCDDGNDCTFFDLCLDTGECDGAPIPGCCQSIADCSPCEVCILFQCVSACDDGNSCTVDSCNPDETCANTQLCLPCQSCSEGACVNDPDLACDDGNACTINDCMAGGVCVGSPNAGSPCNDGIPCTTGDTCTSTGSCVGDTSNCGGPHGGPNL
jgi:hypothetical protein